MTLIRPGLFALLFTWALMAHAHKLRECTLHFDQGININHVLLATTPEERSRGLSGQPPLGSRMLFVFQKPNILSFWMHNTTQALTIGFFDAQGILVQMEDMQAQTTNTHPSKQPSALALELPQGDFKRLGLSIGAHLRTWSCV